MQDKEFFCWRSAECILATLQCDYHPDCPQGEDEDGCGELRVYCIDLKQAVETWNANDSTIVSAHLIITLKVFAQVDLFTGY